MTVKRKPGRPAKKKVVKQAETVSEPKIMEAKTEEVKPEPKKEVLFPDRQPIYGEEVHVPSDATQLTRDGKPWIPEEHGYVARLMDPDIINKMGWRDYQPVPVEAGIRFADHALTEQEIGSTEQLGKGIYYHPKTNEAVQKALGGEELTRLTGGRSNVVKLNSSILALAPIELVKNRRRFAKEVSNNSLERSLVQADQEAQSELGSDVRKFGKFTTGRNAERFEMDRKTRSPKKIWSVPANIK